MLFSREEVPGNAYGLRLNQKPTLWPTWLSCKTSPFIPVVQRPSAYALSSLPCARQSKSTRIFAYPGTAPSVSANGLGNGIIWTIEHTGGNDVLRAYAAGNLGNELYNSNQAGHRDQFGTASHFGTPMIVNGKVYVGTTGSAAVFGLLNGRAGRAQQ